MVNLLLNFLFRRNISSKTSGKLKNSWHWLTISEDPVLNILNKMRLRGNPSDLSCEELNIAVLTFDEKSYILHFRERFEILFEICPSLILSAADAIRTYSSKHRVNKQTRVRAHAYKPSSH